MVVKVPEEAGTACILVCDQLEADEPRTFAWQVRGALPIRRQGDVFRIETRNGRLEGHLLGASSGEVVDKMTPAPVETERKPYVQWLTKGPQASWSYLSAFVTSVTDRPGPPTSVRAVEAEGGWAVELTVGGVRHVALFRRAGAESVCAGGFCTEGSAALVRCDGDSAHKFVMGKP
jgi:hypothetical protein